MVFLKTVNVVSAVIFVIVEGGFEFFNIVPLDSQLYLNNKL